MLTFWPYSDDATKTKYMLQLSKLASFSASDGHLVAPLQPWDKVDRNCFLLTLKGAPEVLLPCCSYILNPEGGQPISLTNRELERISAVQESWSRQGQRVILLARRLVSDEWLEKAASSQTEEFSNAVGEYMTDLIIVGLVGLIDPLKPDIKHTVQWVVQLNHVLK